MGCMKNVVLICEDVAHRNFITYALKEIGVENLNHRLDAWVASTELTGGNLRSVINRVRDVEFNSWKAQCNKHKVLLIVVADADEVTINVRKQDFPAEVVDNSLYVLVVPRRNIETWVRLGIALNGNQEVNDTDDYKADSTQNRKTVKKAVRALFELQITGKTPYNTNTLQVWNDFKNAMDKLKSGCLTLG